MFETFVPSRIRRTLLEHILTHPNERFYLRGLAKALQLSISPLRRELKRLEHSGVLRTHQEANILFYTVNLDSTAFLQLQRAGQETPMLATPQAVNTEAPSPAGSRAPAALQAPGPAPVIFPESSRSVWRSALASPAFLAASAVGVALMLLVTALFSITLTNQQLIARVTRALSAHRADVAVVTPSSGGTMRGSRWQIVPGGFGGFSSGASHDSY